MLLMYKISIMHGMLDAGILLYVGSWIIVYGEKL